MMNLSRVLPQINKSALATLAGPALGNMVSNCQMAFAFTSGARPTTEARALRGPLNTPSLSHRCFASANTPNSLLKQAHRDMETDSPSKTPDVHEFGIDYDISPALKARLHAADFAAYQETDVAEQLEASNTAAVTQQLAEADKHDPLNPKQTLDIMPTHTEVSLFNRHTHVQEDPPLALVAAQGRRHNMEDAHAWSAFTLQLEDGNHEVAYTALLDGHGGDECAQFSANRLTDTLKTHLTKFNEAGLTTVGVANALNHAIVNLSHAYNSKNLPTGTFNSDAGATLNLVMQIDDNLYFANLGDSRAFYIGNTGRIQQLTADHTLKCPEQRAQIIDRGGFVESHRETHRVNGRLAVPAALGAHWTNGAVSARPRIGALPASELRDGVIVQACDGLFEVASTQQLGQRIHESLSEGHSLSEAAADALMAAYHCGSQDNLSIIISKTR